MMKSINNKLNIFLRFVLTGILLFFFSIEIYAEEIAAEECERLFKINYMQKALPWCKKAAAQGDRKSKLNIAIISLDEKAELNWYLHELNTTKNHYYMSNVAYRYELGRGTKKDYSQAIYWYKKASQHKSKTAAVSLGKIYSRGGYGLARDYKKSASWYHQAAKNNELIAFERLGSFYFYGLGVNKDITKAKAWFTRAIEKYDTQAMVLLGLIYESENKKDKAITLWKKASKLHNPHAQFLLGRTYFNNKNYHQAIKLFLLSSQCKESTSTDIPQINLLYCQQQAPYYLGGIYEKGNGVDIDIPKSLGWYNKAFKHGNLLAESKIKNLTE